jgi:hypothetical protein
MFELFLITLNARRSSLANVHAALWTKIGHIGIELARSAAGKES